MTTTAIREKLVDYLKVARRQKAESYLYIMVADEINTAANDWDDDFVKELNRRSRSFTKGLAKTYSWKEAKEAAINKVKSSKK